DYYCSSFANTNIYIF
nr:immunoglobulin light chain junction region [Macaca mulatta]